MWIWLLSGCILFVVLFLIVNKAPWFRADRSQTGQKIDLVLVWAFVLSSFFELLLPDLWAWRFTDNPELLNLVHDPVFSLFRLFGSAMCVILPISVIYHRKNLTRFSVLFGVISYFGDFVLAPDYLTNYKNALSCFSGEWLYDLWINLSFRSVVFVFLEALKLLLILRLLQTKKEDLVFRGGKDVLGFLGLLLPLLLVNTPIQFPQQFTGIFLQAVNLATLNTVDIIWLLMLPVQVFVYTLIFRNKSREDKYIFLSIMALSMLFQYSQAYRSGGVASFSTLPLQLCNFGCYLIAVAVLTRSRKLGCFAATINVMGALFAAVLCDTPGSRGFFFMMNFHYVVTHNSIIVISLLLLTLKLITPLEKKDLKSVIGGFGMYWGTCMLIGTITNALYRATGNDAFKVNFLFMFDVGKAKKFMPGLAFLFDIKLTLGYVEFTLAQLVVGVGFLGLCIGMFFLLYAVFRNRAQKLPADN